MTYEEALEWLSGFQFHGIRPGLERIGRLLARLGHPERAFRAVHIAGTNGKGSTAAVVEGVLRRHGWRTGLYTSPHLVSVRERFLVDGRPVPRRELARLLSRLREALGGGEATYFELTTALAFLLFAEAGVEWAVVECGLGGRLDATNVLVPAVSVVTNVALDHQAYLGGTVPEIAREKAGIIKPGVPVVAGALVPAARRVIEEVAGERGAPLRLWGRDFCVEGDGARLTYRGRRVFADLVPGLGGRFQRQNLGVALAACEALGLPLDEERVREAVALVRWPGRYERIEAGRLVVLDGAHNPAGVEALLESLRADGLMPYDLLYAASNEGGTKPYLEMLTLLARQARRVLVCEPPGPRAPVSVEEWRRALPSCPFAPRVRLVPSWEKALAEAMLGDGLPLVVTGSLYLVGRVRAALAERFGAQGW